MRLRKSPSRSLPRGSGSPTSCSRPRRSTSTSPRSRH